MVRAHTRIITILAGALSMSACSMIPQSSAPAGHHSQTSQTISQSPRAGQCLQQLGQSGSTFSPLPDQYFGAGCSTINTVRLSGLRADVSQVSLSNMGPVACPTANALAGWARYGVDRAARQILGSRLMRIETMGSYACRNVAGTSRRSAHSTAEAIDISGFVLADGRRITVARGWSSGTAKERQFLKVVHASACKRFGTVLGPQYNAAHHDHFHLEKVSDGSSFCR